MNELSGYPESPGMLNCVTASVAKLFLASSLFGDCRERACVFCEKVMDGWVVLYDKLSNEWSVCGWIM